MGNAEASITAVPRGRRKMPIDRVLTWCLRDELPKRREDQAIRGPGLPAIHPMWRAGAFGGRIDNWTRDPGYPLAMGEPHPDALEVERQFLALCETLTKCSVGSVPCPLDLAAYPMALELRGKADLDVLVSTAAHDAPRWLTTCAIHGTRPDYGGAPACEPARSANGKITLWRTVRTPCGEGPGGEAWFTSHDEVVALKGDARDHGTFCKLDWVRSGVEVIEEQMRYAFWHAALVYLVPALQFLASIEVTAPIAPACPWITPVVEVEPLPSLRPARRVALDTRRPAGRRTVRRTASPVRHIDPATWMPPAKWRA